VPPVVVPPVVVPPVVTPPVVVPPVIVVPPTELVPTLTCVGQKAGSPIASSCTVRLKYGGVTVASSAITNVVWDFGDGTPTTSTSIPVESHVYTLAGIYTVFATVTATTTDGTRIETASADINVPSP
jgi:hypothetical protein